ncbi:MAG: flagellar biosynthetic protein FliR [Pseudomonadales bacterium]|jgi:flagellar biosynthetic protein FliR
MIDLTGVLSSIEAAFGPFLRASAMFYAAPVFSARALPTPLRVLLAASVSLLVVPFLPEVAAFEPLSLEGLLRMAQEVLLGAMMGFAIAMAFSVLTQAGENIALGMGLGFASINDPNNGLSVPIVSQFYGIVGTLLFLALGGHGLVIEALQASFQRLPVGFDGLEPKAYGQLVWWGAEMYGFAVLLALPAVASLLLVNLAFGVITRTAPQLNLFAIGFPIMILVGLGVIVLTLPALLDDFTGVLAAAFNLIDGLLGS